MMYCPHCQQKYPENTRFCLEDGGTLSLQDPYKLVGRTLLEKYKIEALIGHGGMGAVYQARHLGINRRVAFKILMPHLASRHQRAILLFIREAETAGSLKHPNVVDVSDAGRIPEEDILYLVMEWLEGEDLDTRLKKCERLSYTEVLDLLRQIAAGLDAAHENRIIHRDLKPSNIMLVRDKDGSEQVKLLDFGLAKSLEEEAGQVSEIIGTPHYASPEHYVKGGRIDRRADIYSLGAILYRMLAGRPPFTGDSNSELIRLHLDEQPSPLGRLLPDIPPALEQLIAQMLAKQPEDRPATAGDVVRVYEKAVAAVPRSESPVTDAIESAENTVLDSDTPTGRSEGDDVHSGGPQNVAAPDPPPSRQIEIEVPETRRIDPIKRAAPGANRIVQAAIAAALIIAAAVAAYIFWPTQAPSRGESQSSTSAQAPPAPEREEVMSVALEVDDGLYTNDKFCHSRHGRLKLRPIRARQSKLANSGQSNLPADTQWPGGEHETPLEHPSPAGNDPERCSALGSGISTPAHLESDSSLGDGKSVQHRGGNQ